MRTDHTSAESTEPPTPVEGDPEAPQEGEDAGGAPRTEPGNPGVDPERMKRAEEDFERAGGN
jgi:hypothetical protein